MDAVTRVVITGAGVVSCFGIGLAPFWRAVREGCSGIRPLHGFPPDTVRFSNAAQCLDFDAALHLQPKLLTLLDRFAQMAVVAAREAVHHAGLERLPAQAAIITGSSAGGQNSMDEAFVTLYRDGQARVHPFTIPRIMSNAAASQISIEFGVTGPSWNVSTACSSSSHALGQAFWLVRSGAAPMALAGGAECVFSTGFLKAWDAMRVVSPDVCRPFSRDRKGLILGEGAAMVVLEPLESARRRGAEILAEFVGFGMSSDAYHMTAPSEQGAIAAMKAALADAGLSPDDIGYINAHGTGTPANDRTEAAAIHALCPSAAVSSTKSMHGHALGAAGALEAVATACALHDRVLPPTIAVSEVDAECPIDVILSPRRQAASAALSNSFAFGGLNAVLAFRSPHAI